MCFSFVGYKYHLDSVLVKLTQERWLKLQDLILRLESKHVFTARCLMTLIGFLASMEKMVPEGHLHMRPFQFHLKEHWKYPQLLDSLLPWTETISAHLDWWQNPTNVMIGADLHPSIQLRQGKKATHKCSRVEGGLSGTSKFQGPVSEPNSVDCNINSIVVVYKQGGNKQGGTHSAEMCALLWKIMTWCHHYQITLKARHIPGCLNVMADLLSRSNQQNGHCIRRCSRCFIRSVKSGSLLM